MQTTDLESVLVSGGSRTKTPWAAWCKQAVCLTALSSCMPMTEMQAEEVCWGRLLITDGIFLPWAHVEEMWGAVSPSCEEDTVLIPSWGSTLTTSSPNTVRWGFWQGVTSIRPMSV